MKIFVTGGAGFIGSYIVRELLKRNHSVTVFDNLSTGYKSNLPEDVNLIVGDVRDKDMLISSLAGYDAVIHLAAQAIVPISVKDPETTYAINVGGGRNLLEAMVKNGVSKLVHSSTTAVYGNPKKQPISEDDPKNPVNPYGESKLIFEGLCEEFHKKHGLNITMFRYFNPFGPHEKHEPESHAIPNFIYSTLESRPLPLYWNGEQIRDFFYVKDLAEMHVQALSLGGFSAYNLGSGQGIAVKDVVEKVFKVAGKTTEINDLGARPGDPPKLIADISKAKSELGWNPTPIEDALKETVDYFQKTLE